MLTFYQYCSYLLPLVFIFLKGYFLSVEFSLYPYLIQKGLVPYRDILDQHLPSLFFGQFSLPYFAVNSPTKLLVILLFLSLGTIYFLQETLKNLKVKDYQLWTLIYAFLTVFFAANTLWVESFVVFLLSIGFYLNCKNDKLSGFVLGLIASQVFLMRPTILIFLLLSFFVFLKHKIISLIGLFFGMALSASYLFRYQILTDFYELAIIFNKDIYSFVQDPIITKRQIISLVIMIVTFLFFTLKAKRWWLALIGLSTLLLVYPRFGLEHLQVFSFIFVYLLSQTINYKHQILFIFILSVAVSLPVWLTISTQRYGNYFYPPQIFAQAEKARQLPGSSLYLYGASDLFYQLSNKVPSGNFYIPSLPWYLNYQKFQDRLTKNLSNHPGYILVDPHFSVDGQKLIDSTPDIYSYIKMNYTLEGYIDHLEVYKPKP